MKIMKEQKMTWIFYIVIFVGAGLIATFPLIRQAKESKESEERLKNEYKKQKEDIIDSQYQLFEIAKKMQILSENIQQSGVTAADAKELKDLSETFTKEYNDLNTTVDEWASSVAEELKALRTAQELQGLSMEAQAKQLNDQVKDYYQYFMKSLVSRLNALKAKGYKIEYQFLEPLPDIMMVGKDPAIPERYPRIFRVEFENGRRWFVTFVAGATNTHKETYPYYYVSLLEANQPDNTSGLNYFELSMKRNASQNLVFYIRSNFDSIKSEIASEDSELMGFKNKIDKNFEYLLKKELSQ